MFCFGFFRKLNYFNRSHFKGQAMLLTVLVLGGMILGASTIAGYLMVTKLRQASNVTGSTKAIFAADSGIECELYKYNFSDPANPRNIDCSSLAFDGGNAGVSTQVINTSFVKSMGKGLNSKRSLTIDFSSLLTPTQNLMIDLRERNCGRCSNIERGTYIAWFAANADCENQFDKPGNKQIEIENYGPCVCGRCSNVEPSMYVEWAPYFNVCETEQAYYQDRQEFTCDSRCWQQPNCEEDSCSGGVCEEHQSYIFSKWYGPGGSCSVDRCFLQTTVTPNYPSCPLNPVCETCSDGIKNQGEAGIDCGGPCPDECPPEESPTSTVYIGSENLTANLFEALKNLFRN